MILKKYILAALIAIAMPAFAQQKELRLDGDTTKNTATISYWRKNRPAALIRYTSPKKYETGFSHRLFSGELKAIASQYDRSNKELGLYYDRPFLFDSKKLTLGGGIEYFVKGELKTARAQAHVSAPLSKHHTIFSSYTHDSGHMLTFGDFFDYGKIYAAVVAAGRTDKIRHREAMFLGIRDYHKSFLIINGNNLSHTSFTKFGSSRFGRAFTKAGFDLDRAFLANRLSFQASLFNFDYPLPQVHPSELGTVGIATRYKKTGRTDAGGVEAYYTLQTHSLPLIVGATGTRNRSITKTGTTTNYGGNLHVGTTIGPVRIIGNIIGRDKGISASYQIPFR